MKKRTKLTIGWFYELLERGECDIMDFKEQLEDKELFGKPLKSYAPNYEEMARDVVAFANKKGGFLFLGIVDKTKEVNTEFEYTDAKIFDLIKQVQDRTEPSITLIPHPLEVEGTKLLVLEIPFSMQMHCTSRAEYLVRCNNGNRAIAPHEMATIMSEKNLIVYDQKTWRVDNWQDDERTQFLFDRIKYVRPDSPLLKETREDFNDALGLDKEDMGEMLPTTTGILLAGNSRALKEIPYSEIKYVHYFEDGTWKAYEWKGNLIEMADGCFNQLKAEIKQREFDFGLFHELVEDYPEVVIRELLINAIVHRDYSRQQCIEIRKYPTYMEFESPGLFPDGVDVTNMLRKTNPKNPSIIEAFRAIKYAEKAGSGFDKIFTELLSKGKRLLDPIVSDCSITFRIDAEIYSDKLIELSYLYKQQTGKDMDVDKLLVLNLIVNNKKISLADLETAPYISRQLLRRTLEHLQEIEFIETSGRTSGLRYILHKSKIKTTGEKIKYSQLKKQDKAKQREAIMRYVNTVGTITNAEAREILKLAETSQSYVSRLLSELWREGYIDLATPVGNFKRVYKKKE
ncbi:MAG: putative DNA binding domain-containing protein [Prevotella sp.]|nr:putative DNA binding domain-containing protein [Prevotella sp.]